MVALQDLEGGGRGEVRSVLLQLFRAVGEKWRAPIWNVRGRARGMEEDRQCDTYKTRWDGRGEFTCLKTRMFIDLQACFDWDAIDQEQGRLEGKMMVLMWFGVEVSAWDRRRTLTILQKDVVDEPLDVRGRLVRVIADVAP